ncbi:MAG: hypothetical protein Kow0069_28000 [Promethearchaeota archaeon]
MDTVVVLDCGCYAVRAGLAGSPSPRVVFRSAVGVEKYRDVGPAIDPPFSFTFGEAAYEGTNPDGHPTRGVHPVSFGLLKQAAPDFFSALPLRAEQTSGLLP